MNALLSSGRWLFAIPFAVFGLFHFIGAEAMAEHVVPSYLPAKTFFVFLTGAALIAASLAMLLSKKDRLATVLLALFLLASALMVHLPNALAGVQVGTTMLLKDIALAGAALMYANYVASDRS